MKKSKILSSLVSFILIISLLATPLSAYSLLSDADRGYTDVKLSQLYEGVTYGKEVIQNRAQEIVFTYVLKIDGTADNLEIAVGVPNDETPLKPGLVQTTSGQMQAAIDNGEDVLAAINGDFFYMGESDKIQPNSITIKDGITLTEYDISYTGRQSFFGVKYDGTAVIGDKALYESVKDDLKEAIGGGPWLVQNGTVQTELEDKRNPRSAVGITAEGDIMFVAVDGRNAFTQGLTFTEMGQYMKDLGCVNVLNLDGGGSTALAIKNPDSGAVEIKNTPSDGTEREVANILMLINKSTVEETTYTATIDRIEYKYAPGEIVQLVKPLSYKSDNGLLMRFSKWVGDTDIFTEDTTAFVMPERNITLTSQFIGVGDTNKNGSLELVDMNILLRYLLSPGGEKLLEGDLNNDGSIDIIDLNLFKRMSVGGFTPQS